MADEIKQQFGIDAVQALDALKKLAEGFKGFEGRINSLAVRLDNFNSRAGKTVAALKQISSAANASLSALKKADAVERRAVSSTGSSRSSSKLLRGDDAAAALDSLLGGTKKSTQAGEELINTMNRISSASGKNLGKAAGDVQKLVISWETLSRVVFTQFIVRAMSQIRDAIHDAVTEAIQFQKQVALITTIAPDASFDEIAQSVRNLSDSFNLPLLDTAAGLYQALSNQVGNFAESLSFTEEAAKFAKATNSSLADSVDLLSGALRSFGLGVEHTSRVAGVFFTAIDKGRVTADELANTMGRVLEPASQVGIELEEIAAAVAAISEKGLGTGETLTQFRGIITALTKPTEAMKRELRELGFESTEAAIATLRLDGLLDSLAKNTKGSAQEFAKLFPNVRGLGGALGITGENLQQFAANIREAQVNGSDFAEQKFLQATSTDAERLTAELNRLKNAFTVEFGQALITTGNNLLSFVGGTDRLITAIKVLTPLSLNLAQGLIAGGVALGGFKIAAIAAANPVVALTAAIGALVLATASAKNFFDNTRLEFANAPTRELEAANKSLLDSARKQAAEILEVQRRADQELVRSVLQRIAEVNKAYLRDVDNAKSANTSLVENTERTLDRIVDARRNFLQAVQQAVSDSREQIRDLLGRIEDIRFRQDERQFQFRTQDFSEAQKAFALMQRASSLASDAESKLREAFRTGDKDLQQRALSLFQRADAAAAEAQAIGQRTDNRGLEVRAAKELESIARRQIIAEQEINALQVRRQQALKVEQERQEKIVAELKRQSQIVLDNTGVFNKQGELLDEDELAKRTAQRQEALKKIASLAFDSKDFRAADALGLAQFVQTIEGDLSQRPIRLAFDVESDIQRVNDEIRRSLGQLDVQLPFLKELEEAVGRSLRNAPDEIAQAVREVSAEVDRFRQQQSQRDILGLDIEKKRQEIQSLLDSLEFRSGRREQLADQFGERILPSKNAIEGTIAGFTRLKDQAVITQAELDKIASVLAGGDERFAFHFDTDLNQISQIATKVKELKDLLSQQQSQVVDPNSVTQFQQFTQVLQKIDETSIDTRLFSAFEALSQATTPASTIANESAVTAENYERAAAAVERLASTQLAQTPVLGQQFGKAMTRYFADGGFSPRGMDTIPAMLRAGESVINPKSTQRFFSQLQAINAGKTPVFRQDGGSVTNIGDINVTVKASENSNLTGRDIAISLRRELRRGTSRL